MHYVKAKTPDGDTILFNPEHTVLRKDKDGKTYVMDCIEDMYEDTVELEITDAQMVVPESTSYFINHPE